MAHHQQHPKRRRSSSQKWMLTSVHFKKSSNCKILCIQRYTYISINVRPPNDLFQCCHRSSPGQGIAWAVRVIVANTSDRHFAQIWGKHRQYATTSHGFCCLLSCEPCKAVYVTNPAPNILPFGHKQRPKNTERYGHGKISIYWKPHAAFLASRTISLMTLMIRWNIFSVRLLTMSFSVLTRSWAQKKQENL